MPDFESKIKQPNWLIEYLDTGEQYIVHINMLVAAANGIKMKGIYLDRDYYLEPICDY